MGRKKKKYPLYERIRILDIGAEGKAIARKDELVIFVSNAIPGDLADLQVTRKRKRYLEAVAVNFHEYSPKREEPFCGHFGVCGGCKWQNLNYRDQLGYKQKQVNDQFQRIAGLPPGILAGISPILPSENTRYYRNKLEFTCSNNRWLTREEIETGTLTEDRNAVGFHIPRMFDKVLDIRQCFLQPEPSNRIREEVREYARRENLDFFDLRKQEGFLRNLIIRNTTTGEIMVILSLFREEKTKRVALLEHLRSCFPEITSLMYVINSKPNDTITDQEIVLHAGCDHITEEMEGLRFRIGPKSFFQTNPHQAFRMYSIIRDFASLTGSEIVYDLYCGTGTIANFLAAGAAQVTGIEQVPEAIRDAEFNARLNGITNTTFLAGDMERILSPDLFRKYGQPDLIILDPPRAGVHKQVIRSVLAAQPGRIIYVSCNPATQARDLRLLSEQYTPERIQPVDMFPHTTHVENVVLLRKISPR